MLASHRLNSNFNSTLFIETFGMLHNLLGLPLGDYVTFLRFQKQCRAWNSHNNLYLYTCTLYVHPNVTTIEYNVQTA